MSTMAAVRPLHVDAAQPIALPLTGRLGAERLSPRAKAQLQGLCAGSGAASVDNVSAWCSQMMRSRDAVLARR